MTFLKDVTARAGVRAWYRLRWTRYIDRQTGELQLTKMAEECIVDLSLDLVYNDDELEAVYDMAVDFEVQLEQQEQSVTG